jgi:ABC-type transporter Mla MlaB component
MLHRVLRELAPAVLDVDLAGVAFCDCSGLSALVTVRNAAAEAGGQVTVSSPQPIVRRILDLTGLLDTLTAPIDRPPPQRSDPLAPVGLPPRHDAACAPDGCLMPGTNGEHHRV